MEIEVKDTEKSINVKIGDIFESKKFGFYILVENERGYSLSSLEGREYYMSETNGNDLVNETQKEVEKGLLKHYSQDEWKLQLIKV